MAVPTVGTLITDRLELRPLFLLNRRSSDTCQHRKKVCRQNKSPLQLRNDGVDLENTAAGPSSAIAAASSSSSGSDSSDSSSSSSSSSSDEEEEKIREKVAQEDGNVEVVEVDRVAIFAGTNIEDVNQMCWVSLTLSVPPHVYTLAGADVTN
jgi:BRCT domain type II-containing protein